MTTKQNFDYYPDGECPNPDVYPQKKHDIIIYDHEGNAFTRPKIKMGFDLTVRNELIKNAEM